MTLAAVADSLIVEFSAFANFKDNVPKGQKLPLPVFKDLFNYPDLSVDKLAGEAWSPAWYAENTTRAKANVVSLGCLAFDFDRGTDGSIGLTEADVKELFGWLDKTEYLFIAHNTFGSGFVYPREKLRVILFPERPVSVQQYKHLWSATVRQMPVQPDASCSDASRIYFAPCVHPDHAAYYRLRTGGHKLLNVHRNLNLNLNGAGNYLEQLTTATEKEPALNRAAFALGKAAAERGEDLNAAQRAIWSECKAALSDNTTSEPVKDWFAAKATCDEAVEHGFLVGQSKEDVKELVITEKMLAAAAKALKKEVGFVEQDYGQLSGAAYRMGRYTPHVLNPELVRKELFKAATQGGKDGVRGFLTDTEANAAIDTGMARGAKSPLYVFEGWKKRLLLDPEKGTLVVCDENACLFFSAHPEVEGLLKWNVRKEQPFFMYVPPWVTYKTEFPCLVEDHDAVDAGRWLAQQMGRPLVGMDRTLRALLAVAAQHPFDPFKDWLESLRWDGKSRLNQWLHFTCGVEDNPYHSMVGTKFVLSAVARTLTPGCSAQYVLVLTGKQGIGKSAVFRELAGSENFSADIGDIHKDEASFCLEKFVIVELAELAAFRKADLEMVKRFITANHEDLRRKYARSSKPVIRRAVLGGTTNVRDFLQDPTGNRRFWPVECGKMDLPWLVANREQLWAEALQKVREGERWWPNEAEEVLCVSEQEKYEEVDDIAHRLDFFNETFKAWPTVLQPELGSVLPDQLDEQGKFKWATVQQVHLIAGTDIQNRADQLRLRKLCDQRRWKRKVARIAGKIGKIVEIG